MSSMTNNNLLTELLDLVGRDQLEDIQDTDIESVLKAGVPHALKTHLDLMLGAGNERVKMWIADRWLERSGHGAIQKAEITQKITFDPATLLALQNLAAEDQETITIDVESTVCPELEQADEAGPGGAATDPPDEVPQEPVLPGEGSAGVCGPDA